MLKFVGNVCGKAEEAVDFYVSTFRNAKADMRVHYGTGE